jgi:DNA-binding response OmpR family regulator
MSMNKGRILVVEDDFDIANILNIYFDGQGYAVDVASTGAEALAMVKKERPHLIMLDIMLPDMDGYTICQDLRSSPRTSHIPIIFLTQKDERSDRISGLEMGADDYITKPFDIEELKLRVQNALRRAERERYIDPRTGLPAGGLIQQRLQGLRTRSEWALLDCRIEHLEDFQASQGFLAADELLHMLASLLSDVVQSAGGEDDFLGHAGSGNFIILTTPALAADMRSQIKERFRVLVQESPSPGRSDAAKDPRKLKISIGIIDDGDGPFADPAALTEAALSARRKDSKTHD